MYVNYALQDAAHVFMKILALFALDVFQAIYYCTMQQLAHLHRHAIRAIKIKIILVY